MPKPTIAIVGASSKRSKFGNKAVRAYQHCGYEVFPVNPREASIEGISCFASVDDIPESPDRVSMYLPPHAGLEAIESIARKKPKELWLNPGAESQAIIKKAEDLGLNVVVGCSIVDLGVSPAQFGDE